MPTDFDLGSWGLAPIFQLEHPTLMDDSYETSDGRVVKKAEDGETDGCSPLRGANMLLPRTKKFWHEIKIVFIRQTVFSATISVWGVDGRGK